MKMKYLKSLSRAHNSKPLKKITPMLNIKKTILQALGMLFILFAFIALKPQEPNPGRAVALKYMDKYVYLMSKPDREYEAIDVPDFKYSQISYKKPADFYETAIETAMKKFSKYNLDFDGMVMNGDGGAYFIKFKD